MNGCCNSGRKKILALYLSNLQSPDFQCKTTEANVRQSKSNLPLKKSETISGLECKIACFLDARAFGSWGGANCLI